MIHQENAHYDNQPNPGNIVSRLALHVRTKMFDKIMTIANLDSQSRILDVGATSNQRPESNFFEKRYPHPENIVVCGIEDASPLKSQFPGLEFIKADGKNLPFKNNSFDLVTCFAVVEHVGSRQNQREFIAELCRVGRACVVTTPNRWYPMEVHTLLPLVHWLPPAYFRKVASTLGNTFYSKEENLNLLDHTSLRAMFPEEVNVKAYHHKLLGLTSNLFFYANKST